MKKIYKKDINEMLGAKDDWHIFGWSIWQAGIYYDYDEKWNIYKAFKGQGLNAAIYDGRYELNAHITDEVEAWLAGHETKTYTVDVIYDKIQAEIEEYESGLKNQA